MTTQDKPAVGPLSAGDLARTTVATDEVFRLTLCGSTKFRAEYELWNKRLTLAGFLVYSVSGFGHSGDTFTEEEKSRLDQIHLAKIDASHAIVVLNVGGYVGESTSREIAHAKAAGKPVYFLEGDNLVYRLRTGPDGPSSLRYRAFDWGSLAPTAPVEAGGSERETVEDLVRELASERAAADRQAHEECGTELWDLSDDDFMDDARAFVMRCINLRPQPSGETLQSLAQAFEDAMDGHGAWAVSGDEDQPSRETRDIVDACLAAARQYGETNDTYMSGLLLKAAALITPADQAKGGEG